MTDHRHTFHVHNLNSFMEEMQHYIRFNKTKTEWGFSATAGLCINLSSYVKKFTYAPSDRLRIKNLLEGKLIEAGFTDTVYPFESVYAVLERAECYRHDSENILLYSNPLRVSFIQNWKQL